MLFPRGLVRSYILVEEGWANEVDGRVAPRSGLAAKHSIDVGAGVIDADYRGELKVLLFNLSDMDFPGMSFPPISWGNPADIGTVKAGDRIAQLVIERVSRLLWTRVVLTS